MAVDIRCTQIADGLVLVNGKEVIKDMDGVWICQEQLSMIEAKFFGEFRETLERCNRGKWLQATYRV